MSKQTKRKILISSLLVLLPIAVGLLVWDRLPEQMATHWGADGTADGFSSRLNAVITLPLIMLPLHWLVIFVTHKDPKNKGQSSKVLNLSFWLIPAISLFGNAMTYAAAFGKEPDPFLLVGPLLGVVFVVVGNYLPKCKQNYTFGIRVRWALENEENWNATHRFGGKVFVACGLVTIASAFLPAALLPWVMIGVIVFAAGGTILYSWLYHRRQLREGSAAPASQPLPKSLRIARTIGLGITVALLIFCSIFVSTGDIQVEYGADSLTIRANYWTDLTIALDAIDSAEYRDTDEPGSRTNGFGGTRILAGSFRNDEFGNYTRYSYTKCDACIVLASGEKTLVFNARDAEATRALYEELLTRLP